MDLKLLGQYFLLFITNLYSVFHIEIRLSCMLYVFAEPM